MAFPVIPKLLGKDRWTITPLMLGEDRIAFENSLFRILELAHRQQVDPRHLVQLYAKEHWGINRWRLHRVLKNLHPTKSVEQSLIDCGAPLDSHLIACLRIGKSISQPAMAWEDLLHWHRPMIADSAKIWRNQMLYWSIVGLFLFGISAAFWFFIGGNLRLIWAELDFYSSHIWIEWIEVVSMTMISCLVILLFVYWIVRTQKWLMSRPIRGMAESGQGFAVKRREFQRQLALCLRAGLSEQTSLATILHCNSNPEIRRCLTQTIQQCESGLDTWQGLTQANLIDSKLAMALRQCDTPDVQSWLLKQGTVVDREAGFFRKLWRSLWVQPLLTLSFGLVVLLIGYALIGGLSELVRHLAERHG